VPIPHQSARGVARTFGSWPGNQMTAGREDANPNTPAPDAMPSLRVDMHRDEAVWKLEVMSRRGRLPGFRRTMSGCAVNAHGSPYDKTLHLDAADTSGPGTLFTTRLLLERKMPTITALIFIATVWPGVLLTDSFMRLHLDFYTNWTNQGLQTWWWYVPLTVLSLIWAWFAALAKSNKTASKSAREALEKIAAELNGRIVTGAEAEPTEIRTEAEPNPEPGPEAGSERTAEPGPSA